MRTFLAALLLASIAITATGCPMGCSAFAGGGDQVYAHGADQLILCENGGYSATVNGAMNEGFYTENAAGSSVRYTGTDGPTGSHAFDLSPQSNGTETIPELGGSGWTAVTLDQVAADHANTLCTDLETRAWWTSSSTH
jgi:hypothetical protein